MRGDSIGNERGKWIIKIMEGKGKGNVIGRSSVAAAGATGVVCCV